MKYFILSILLLSTTIMANDSETIIKSCKEIIKTEKTDTNKTVYENCVNILKEDKLNKLKKEEAIKLELERNRKKVKALELELEKNRSKETLNEKNKNKELKLDKKKDKVNKKSEYDKIISINLFMAAYPGLIVGAAPKIEFISGNILIGVGVGYFGVAEPGGGGHIPSFDPAIGVLFNLGFNYSWDYFRVAITGEFNLGIPNHLTASLALTAGVKLFKFIEISGKIGLFTAGVSAGIHF